MRQTSTFRYRDPAHFIDAFRMFYGPVHKVFLALDDQGQRVLEADILALIDRFNAANDGSVHIPGECLEIIARV